MRSLNSGSLSNCINYGDIIYDDSSAQKNEEIGGIVGSNTERSYVNECVNCGNISGYLEVGGISGYGNEIENCYNIGDIRGNNTIGGICGSLWNGMKTSYNIGMVNGVSSVGGLAGSTRNDSIVNCYYLSGTADVAVSTDSVIEDVAALEVKDMSELQQPRIIWLVLILTLSGIQKKITV